MQKESTKSVEMGANGEYGELHGFGALAERSDAHPVPGVCSCGWACSYVTERAFPAKVGMLAVGGWVDVSTQTMAGADGAGQGSSREGEGWHMEVAGVGPEWAVGQGSSESRSALGAPQQQFGSVNKLTHLIYDVMRWLCEKDGIFGGEKVGVNEKDLGDFSMPAPRK